MITAPFLVAWASYTVAFCGGYAVLLAYMIMANEIRHEIRVPRHEQAFLVVLVGALAAIAGLSISRQLLVILWPVS